ncbi:MAG: N-acetylmuramoyl-L-alanine amidase [Sodalis sp. (in: enterobacteria)]|uniref:N-acetylmuramoyl-L-alanine amidase n=1 Tax=Sodalis sp. (in: enterobacteria) TaxID=1898979 RepID=UPI003F34CF82
MSRAIHRIIIHCAATPNGRVLGRDGENAAQVIDCWHRARGFHCAAPANDNGLTSIGYHGVIDVAGQWLTGRDVEEVGAHVRGHNAHSLGLCLVGGGRRPVYVGAVGRAAHPAIDAACALARGHSARPQ